MMSLESRVVQIEDKLNRALRRLRIAEDKAANVQQQQQAARGNVSGLSGLIKARSTSTITAISGDTMGTGTADLYFRDGTDVDTDSIEVNVRSFFTASVATATNIYLAWIEDGYELIAADCPP